MTVSRPRKGATVSIKNRTHPVMRGITWDKFPPLLGYNRATARPGVQVLATLRSSPRGPDDPLIVVREYELGRTMAFASDTTPPLGREFHEMGRLSAILAAGDPSARGERVGHGGCTDSVPQQADIQTPRG